MILSAASQPLEKGQEKRGRKKDGGTEGDVHRYASKGK
jgi:hypothetical protein